MTGAVWKTRGWVVGRLVRWEHYGRGMGIAAFGEIYESFPFHITTIGEKGANFDMSELT